MAFCTACGAPLATGDKFCGICGAAYSEDQPSNKSAARRARRKPGRQKPATGIRSRGFIPALSVLAVAVVITVGMTFQPEESALRQHDPATPLLSEQQLTHIRHLEDAVQKNPGDVPALIALGNTYYDIENNSEAIRYYAAALAQDPDNVDVRVDMAVCYFRQQNLERATAEIERAIAINPTHPMAHFNIGVIANAAGKHEDAAGYWTKFLELAPDSPHAGQVQDFLQHWETHAE